MPADDNAQSGLTDTRAEGQGSQRTAPTDEREQKQDDPPQQEWKWLYSSNLVQYRYRADSRTLTIIFHGNRKYTFRGVDRDTADGLGTAGSAGSYFSKNIKGKFPFSRE